MFCVNKVMMCCHFVSFSFFVVCFMENVGQGTSGSRGGAPGARPPNGRGPMIFYAKNAQFSQFFPTLASLAIHFKHNFNRNMSRTR